MPWAPTSCRRSVSTRGGQVPRRPRPRPRAPISDRELALRRSVWALGALPDEVWRHDIRNPDGGISLPPIPNSILTPADPRGHRHTSSRQITHARHDSTLRMLTHRQVLTSPSACITFLREWKVLRETMNCHKCTKPMVQEYTTLITDGRRFRCTRCRTTTTIRKHSIFEHSRLPITSLVTLIYLWAMDVPQRVMAQEAGISKRIIVDWCNLFRELISFELINNFKPLGGLNRTVSVDESHLAKRKLCANGQARPVISEQIWVFGGVCHETGEVFMEIVENRSAATLLPLIRKHIAPQTTIHSDKWAAYNGIRRMGMGYRHLVVNHSRYYTDPVWGISTNRIEGVWKCLKAKFKRCNGIARSFLPTYVDEYLWKVRKDKNQIFQEFLRTIAANPRFNIPSTDIPNSADQ